MRSSDVCQQAVAKAQASARLKLALGQPITQGWYVTGSINISNDSGSADVSIPISGPKGSATIHAVAKKAAGVWTFSVLRVTLPDGKQMNLLPATDVTLQLREQLLVHPVEAAIAEDHDHIAALGA
jgi:hypothetical protein